MFNARRCTSIPVTLVSGFFFFWRRYFCHMCTGKSLKNVMNIFVIYSLQRPTKVSRHGKTSLTANLSAVGFVQKNLLFSNLRESDRKDDCFCLALDL